MIFWIAATAITIIVVGLIALPFFTRRPQTAVAAEYDVEVYKSQLSELQREKATGMIGAAEADAARTEIAKRLLAADSLSDGQIAASASRAGFPAMALALVAATPAAALSLYFWFGSPGLQDYPFLARTAEIEQTGAGGNPSSLESMVERVAQRIEDTGGNLDDWVMLARTNMTLQRFGSAAEAFSQAMLLSPNSPQLKSSYGEALVFGSQGSITMEAQMAFKEALTRDPVDPRARFYLAESDWQKGYREKALESWLTMYASAEPGAPWLPNVRSRAIEAAEVLGVDISERLPEPVAVAAADGLPGPTGEDVAAARDMSPEERQEMIRGMVRNLAGRLQSDPMDFQGWLRLIRSRVILGEMEAAQADLDRASQVFENAPFPKQQLAELARELGLAVDESASGTRGPTASDIAAAQDMSAEDQKAMIGGMVDRLASRLEADPMDFQGWLQLIRSRTVLGDTEAAQADMDRASRVFENAPVPKQRLAELARELGLSMKSEPGAPGPTAGDIAAAMNMSDEDQKAMIGGMVDKLASRLEANPDDLEGWMRLAQSYNVLGRSDDSLAALKKAETSFPDDISVLLLQARIRRSIAGKPVTPETTALMERILAIDPRNVEANWFVALNALGNENAEQARQYFDRAIDALPEGSSERPTLVAERDRLLDKVN